MHIILTRQPFEVLEKIFEGKKTTKKKGYLYYNLREGKEDVYKQILNKFRENNVEFTRIDSTVKHPNYNNDKIKALLLQGSKVTKKSGKKLRYNR